jgi:methionyl-tRNA formyltransferase
MRIVFLGTPEFAVPSLDALLFAQYDVRAVITQPDRPAGRGLRLTPPPVKVVAAKTGIRVLQPLRLKHDPQIQEMLRQVDPELIVVAAFGQILPASFFNYPRLGTLNVHGSLLPKYRGAAPIAHAILNGETETGTTIMKIDEGMDTGEIISQRSIPLDDKITTGELEVVLARQGAELLLETIPKYESGALVPYPQDERLASFAPRITKEQAPVDWEKPASLIHNQVRAFNPWPVASSALRGQVVKIWRSLVAPPSTSGGTPGQIVSIDREGVTVRCGESTNVLLTELQLAGRNRHRASDLANGLQLKTGERLG